MNTKKAMQRGGPALGESAQAASKRFMPAGSGREPVEQRAQIKAGAASDDRKSLPPADFVQNLPRAAGVRAGGKLTIKAHDVDKVVGDAVPRRHGKLGGPDIQSSINLNGIAAEDFSLKRFGEKERQLALAGACWPEHRNQRPQSEIRVNRHCILKRIQWAARPMLHALCASRSLIH